MNCPCGLTRDYSHCCEPLHKGVLVAETPERLMRSRFSAFALNQANYLEQTWHFSTRPQLDLNDNLNWVKLQIIKSSQSEDKGMVHFRAFYKVQYELGMLEEKSEFVREQGQWFYLQGEVLA